MKWLERVLLVGIVQTGLVACASDASWDEEGEALNWEAPAEQDVAQMGEALSASCGDGRLDRGEQCDDGNRVTSDSCTNMCRLAVCGDAILGPGEQCDDGNTSNRDSCTNTCRLAVCGDGILGPGEQCDDGNTSNRDSCTTWCRRR